MAVRYIGDRISYSKKGGETIIIISGKIPRWQEAILAGWLFLWAIAGVLLIDQYFFVENTYEARWGILIMLLFWLYYQFRVGRTFVWRLIGRELIRIADGEIKYKRAYKDYGKAHTFFIENIKSFGLVEQSRWSINAVMGSSFWVMGGEKLGFDHLHRSVKFGMGITDEEAEKLAKVVKAALLENRRKSKS